MRTKAREDPGAVLPPISLTRGQRLGNILLRLLIAWLAAVGFALMGTALLGVEFNLAFLALGTAIALALLALLTWTRRQLLLSLSLLLLLVLLFWLSSPDLEALGLWVRERYYSLLLVLDRNRFLTMFPDMEAQDLILIHQAGSQLVWQLSALASGAVSYFFGARLLFPGMLGTLGLVMAVLCQYYQRLQGLPGFWLVLLAAVLFGVLNLSPSTRVVAAPTHPLRLSLQRILAAVLAASLALAAAFITSQSLGPADVYSRSAQGQVDELRDALPDGWFPDKSFAKFTLNQAGYYPLETRLGGTAEPSEAPVLILQGQVSGLLRGQTSTVYTGSSWERDPQEDRWRYQSGRAQEQREAVFEQETPLLAEIGDPTDYRDEQNYHVELLGGGGQVLFTSGLPDDVVLDSNTPYQIYFNRDGVLYVTSALQRGHGYRITGEAVDQRSAYEDFAAASYPWPALNYSALEPDSNYADDPALADYLQLPDSPTLQADGYVYNIALDVATTGRYLENYESRGPATGELPGWADSDWNRAEAAAMLPQDNWSRAARLSRYLQQMDYSLEMPIPPAEQDFVEHVLMMQQGYCTYFASALTVMARINGIPARYVEGFAVSPGAERYTGSGDGLEITGRQAHAWTEIYLTGLGWVAFDPTPGGVGGAQSWSEPTPLGQALTTPTPSPQPETEVTSAPAPTPPDSSTPTPSPLPETWRPPFFPDESGEGSGLAAALLWLLLLIPVLLLVFWLSRWQRRRQLSDPGRASALYRRLAARSPQTAGQDLARRYIREYRALLRLVPDLPLMKHDVLGALLAEQAQEKADRMQQDRFGPEPTEAEKEEWSAEQTDDARKAPTLRQELNHWLQQHPQWLVDHPEMLRPLRAALAEFEAAAFARNYEMAEDKPAELADLMSRLQDLILRGPSYQPRSQHRRRHQVQRLRCRILLRYHLGP